MKVITNNAVDQLRHNARTIVRELGLLNDAYFEIGVTLAERHLLIELNTCQNPTMGEIAERLLIDKSTASRLISKATKKGYIECIIDKVDKRKRYLRITKKGQKVLNAFEPIAFDQTKQALLTLSNEEIKTVFQGVALYAKGLRCARLIKLENADEKTESLSDITEQLNKMGYALKTYQKKDETGLYKIFKEVVDSGSQFPYESNSLQEFRRQFLNKDGQVYVCHSPSNDVIGGFYIKSNFPGRSKHIANAAYMIKDGHRGKGVGSLLIKASLHFAKSLGFQALQFNMVLSQNTNAVNIYKKLGFKILATLPTAVRNLDETYQDGYVMYRTLDDINKESL